MLDPESAILPAIVATLKTNTGLVTGMGGDASRIVGYRYLYGVESSLELAINKMLAPSLLVAWEATQPGNFDGQTIWKHIFSVYIRLANQSQAVSPIGYGSLWATIVNGAVNGTGRNIRTVNILSGLDIMDTPGIIHALDEDRMDYFVGRFVFPEIGDN